MCNTCHQEIFTFFDYLILNLQYSVYEFTVCLKVTLYSFIPMHNCKHTCYVFLFFFGCFFFIRHVTSISQIPKSKILLQPNRKKNNITCPNVYYQNSLITKSVQHQEGRTLHRPGRVQNGIQTRMLHALPWGHSHQVHLKY